MVGPSITAWPICETSNRPARVARVQVFGEYAGRILIGMS